MIQRDLIENDLVSIIMPSYNTASFITETIDSVLNQTYSNWELIIVDDNSTDNTDNLISKYVSDSRIIYVKNSTNVGAAVSRNRALTLAKGRWIAFLDSDDLWMPNKLQKQIDFMITNSYSFSYTKYEQINENGEIKGIQVSGPKRITRAEMYQYCWPGCLTVMYDQYITGKIQIADIKKNNDYAMWLKVIQYSDCFLLNETLSKYRIRTGSISNHNYIKLISWHYKLFREVEKFSRTKSMFLTIQNLIFGLIKKIVYVSKYEGK